jgi:hypothetical protein
MAPFLKRLTPSHCQCIQCVPMGHCGNCTSMEDPPEPVRWVAELPRAADTQIPTTTKDHHAEN